MTDIVPIMRFGRDLLVTLQGDLDDTTVERVEREITEEVARTHAAGVLMDISRLDIVDSFVAGVLGRLGGMIRLLGADTALVGMQPAVAITLVELGAPMGHLHTALNAEQGLALLRRLRDDAGR